MLSTNLSVLLMMVALFASLRLTASTECSKAVKLAAKNVSAELMMEAQAYRISKMNPINAQFQVHGKNYTAIGLLGEGNSVAYLVKDDSGKLFVLKEIKSDEIDANWAFSANYEKVATEFYNEMGFIVPRVLAIQYKKNIGKHTVAYLIKEYRLGLTVDDLMDLSFGTNEFWIQISKSKSKDLAIAMNKLKEAHRKFHDWLEARNINLHDRNFSQLDRLIFHGDIAPRNMLLDAQTGQWILIDP